MAAEWKPLRIRGAYGFGRSLGLVAAGGYGVNGQDDHLKSVVATKDGKLLTNLLEMPLALRDHCLVVLEDGIFMTGGESHEGVEGETRFRRNTYLYNMATNSWKETEQMRLGRKKPVCGHIHGVSGVEPLGKGVPCTR